MSNSFKNMLRKARQIRDELWSDELRAQNRRMKLLMRVFAILWRGVVENGLLTRAAALSYSSLLAMAPVLGVIVLFTGSFLKGDPEVQIKKVIVFIAPSISQYVRLDHEAARKEGVEILEVREADVEGAPDAAKAEGQAQTPETGTDALDRAQGEEMADAFDMLLSRMIEGVKGSVGGINKGGKGIAGAIGGILLIWVGISLLVAIENALNGIWGVKKGRPWERRIVLYWAVLSLGVLAGFALIGLISASTIVGMLDSLPMGKRLSGLLIYLGPVVSVLGLALLLSCFYQFFPNTRVRFLPALTGGVCAATLLVLNNFLSILYINNVIRIQSLYGSMGIVLVLMFGLYLFWAFLLLGGQITYAVQNAQYLANQKAWENVSERTRETVTFATYVLVCRRFSRCQPPLSSDQLAQMLCVPTNILNESLSRLEDMGLITSHENEGEEGATINTCFFPSRPLRSLDMAGFRRMYEEYGSDAGVNLISKVDALIDTYRRRMDECVLTTGGDNMEVLLDKIEADGKDKASEAAGV